ncbi:MAG: ABC transporter permease [Geminicoccaceae bacterium]|nr:ABC transporter permease [Geminicoccaceae bacterium]MCB9943671.1 ABC transporter permease [Geminicoccaceae bacterium]
MSKRAALAAFVLFDLVILGLPTLIILGASFTSGDIVTFPPEGLSLRWYAELWRHADFTHAFWRSAWISLVCTVVSLPAGTLAALALVRYGAGRNTALQVYLLLPFTIPLVVSGIGLMLVFGWLRILGSLWPIGIALAVINLPFMIWAVAASANQLSGDLEDAAANCGASPLRCFFTITLPAVMPGIITGSLLMFILAFNEFLVSLFLVDARIVTLPVSIYNSIRSLITPDLAAVSVVYILVAGIAIAALDRLVGLDLFLKSR